MSPGPEFSVVVPCYNEAPNLQPLLEAFSAAGRRWTGEDLELILVDNGSSDGTNAELARLLPLYPFARSVRVEVNKGYGFGILSGLSAACGEYIGWTHGDLQFDPGAIAEAAGLIADAGGGNIFVKGLRRGRPFSDRFFTAGMSLFETLLMGTPLRDINGQPTLFHRSLLEAWNAPPHDFSLDLYAYAAAAKAGFKIVRFDVVNSERARGASSWNRGLWSRLRLALRTIVSSVRIRTGRGPR
ncbi:MAG: glycosyltransferase family 2 protein [Elusimicrobia bacterium]|nr:glycosyltransferase family 2 protein [Elusimicrobiota bacterium]